MYGTCRGVRGRFHEDLVSLNPLFRTPPSCPGSNQSSVGLGDTWGNAVVGDLRSTLPTIEENEDDVAYGPGELQTSLEW